MIHNLEHCGQPVAVRLYEYVLEEVALLLPPMDTLAVIDTAAPCTFIQEGVATSLGYVPDETVKVTTVSLRSFDSYQYRVWLGLLEWGVLEVSVIEVPFKLHSDTRVKCKIGRDILQLCVLTYNGRGNTFSYDF
jgi:hypothetical protein